MNEAEGLSLLDTPRPAWDAFLGTRCGVPYSELDFYREHSKVRALFHSKPNNTLCGKWMLPIQAQTPDECKPAICARLIAAEGER